MPRYLRQALWTYTAAFVVAVGALVAAGLHEDRTAPTPHPAAHAGDARRAG